MIETTTHRCSRLQQLLGRFAAHGPTEELLSRLAGQQRADATATGLRGSSEAVLLYTVAERLNRPVVVVTGGPEQANDLYDDLTFLMPPSEVGHYPSRQILPYDFRAPVGEIMGRRISTLEALLDRSLKVMVCSVRALLEPTMYIEELRRNRISLKQGSEVDLGDIVQRLVRLGFRRVPNVEEVGDFALRGGLVDFFSPGSDSPVRVEFFGDEIETIRHFEVATQRTIERITQVGILPRREIPITQQTLEEYLSRLAEQDADYIRSRYLNDPELPGLEWLAILFGIDQSSLLDYFTEDAIVVLEGEGSLKDEADAILREAEGLYRRLKGRLTALPRPQEYYRDAAWTFERLGEQNKVDLVPFKGGRKGIIDFGCREHPSLGARLDLLAKTLREFDANRVTHVVVSDTEGQAARLKQLLENRDELDGEVPVEVADLNGGFVCLGGGFALLTDHEIFTRYHRRVRRKKFREGVAISDYTNLTAGDFVVHTDHGVARYVGLETITVDSRSRDCLLLQYAEKDRLYVPIEEFNRVSKYSGKGSAPALTRLGGVGWERLKKRAKKAVGDMAADLIRLYAQRRAAPGFSFGDETLWLRQLEASFPYEETPDQFKAIKDVKHDMAEERAMDRLVCGDVGYGKTEVAVRAAFKAIERGKQVAVLVPTTVLAQQHFQTFSDRLREMPVRIEMLSRFRTKKEQATVVEDIAAGKVDLVIGTHRLFSKDVSFRDLGLLVVDEEHRFGVRHKETLRKLRASVDTVSMSATPIPRTLQMSLIGVRDMSLISTSPKDRLPIITEIVEFDPAIIATAILREIDRGGQVFFVHNRVQTIEAMHRYLKKTLPQVGIAIAHGQMHERSLEGVMLGFLARRFDVLLCTSIIESGLDIPNANTIIINRADRFGLAQLYQLRGRVGRSARRAYAYLLTPAIRLLSADAVKRLRALEAHSDLGSGFALAMRDLEIRGAGTILGPRQSGYIEEVGFDLYNKLLEEAVAELKGEEIRRLPETTLETDMELHLSDAYVNDRQHKVDIYRRLADCRTLEEVERMREEVTDRFGKMPQSAMDLFEAMAVKISAAGVEIEKIRLHGTKAQLFFRETHQLTRTEAESFQQAAGGALEFSLAGHPRITLDMGRLDPRQRLSHLRRILGSVSS